jgi:hypothetical protein
MDVAQANRVPMSADGRNARRAGEQPRDNTQKKTKAKVPGLQLPLRRFTTAKLVSDDYVASRKQCAERPPWKRSTQMINHPPQPEQPPATTPTSR